MDSGTEPRPAQSGFADDVSSVIRSLLHSLFRWLNPALAGRRRSPLTTDAATKFPLPWCLLMLTLDKAPASTPASGAFRAAQPDPTDNDPPVGLTELTTFTLRHRSGLEQIALANENPLCRLLARTREGERVCNRGCGIDPAAPPDRHVCPFGMAMQRLAPAGAPDPRLTSRWIGRRFLSLQSLHAALDRLLAEGLDEETIFAHLPSNPVVLIHELRRAAGDAARETDHEPSTDLEIPPPEPAGAAAPTRQPDEPEFRPSSELTHLLEFVLQLQTLLASSDQPGSICERFLRALGGLLPFDAMSIYLRESVDAEPVLVSTVEREPADAAQAPSPRAHDTRLPAHAIGALALGERRVMIQQGDTVRRYAGEFRGPGRVALPFPLSRGEAMGVWLAEIDHEPRDAAAEWQRDAPLWMQVLAEVLAARLAQVPGNPEPARRRETPAPAFAAPPAPAPPACPRDGLARRLAVESVRCARHGYGFSLVLVGVAFEAERVALPEAELSDQFRAALRPYDECFRLDGGDAVWAVLLPHTSEHEARRVAFRLISIVEDVLDAHGGAEEMGIRPGAGISLWGVDASSADQLIHQAEAALARALACTHEPVIQVFGHGEDAEVG